MLRIPQKTIKSFLHNAQSKSVLSTLAPVFAGTKNFCIFLPGGYSNPTALLSMVADNSFVYIHAFFRGIRDTDL